MWCIILYPNGIDSDREEWLILCCNYVHYRDMAFAISWKVDFEDEDRIRFLGLGSIRSSLIQKMMMKIFKQKVIMMKSEIL